MLQGGKDHYITGENLEDERSLKKNGRFSNTHEDRVQRGKECHEQEKASKKNGTKFEEERTAFKNL